MRCLSPQGGALSADGRRLSVRLSDSKSKMEGRRKLKIDRKEADKHRPNLEVERPKVKVTKPIVLRRIMRQTSNLVQGWRLEYEYDDPHHRFAR